MFFFCYRAALGRALSVRRAVQADTSIWNIPPPLVSPLREGAVIASDQSRMECIMFTPIFRTPKRHFPLIKASRPPPVTAKNQRVSEVIIQLRHCKTPIGTRRILFFGEGIPGLRFPGSK